ncbi:hypothetical protein [Sphingomonas sp. M1-B02]|uniref:hypothetical protein n=1 Tax=Sphingomonas sp. M1-B02 TaxID=3114300 RepID=UPI00224037E3|nr:hypothetical protein [Sphingomonas sp. S6-11]UZK65359.1 hypothetical protein OKW87_12675 [Sphingomonas sp. S6-11]
MAQQARANAKGTLTVEYIYESSGTDRERGSIGSTSWRAKRNATITADVYALPANDIPVLHDQAAALAQAQRKVDRAKAITDRVADPMAAAKAIGERCGDDEACFEREGMKLAQQMQAKGQIGEVRSAASDMAKLAGPGSRYQYWGGNFGTGSYAIDENVQITVLDPGARTPVTTTIVRQGGGALPAAVKGVRIPTSGKGNLTGVEFDGAGNTLALQLPVPGLTPGIETVSGSTDKSGAVPSAGTKSLMLDFPVKAPGDEKYLIVPITSKDWRNQSGQYVINFTKGRWQEKGRLTIRWRFTAA